MFLCSLSLSDQELTLFLYLSDEVGYDLTGSSPSHRLFLAYLLLLCRELDIAMMDRAVHVARQLTVMVNAFA